MRLLMSYVSFSSNVSRMTVRSSLKAGSASSGGSQKSSQLLAKSMDVSCPSSTMFGVMNIHCGSTDAFTSAAKSLKLRCSASRSGTLTTES